MSAGAKGTHQKWVRQLQCHLQCIDIIGIVACKFFPTAFLEIAACGDFGTASSRCSHVRYDSANMLTQFGRNFFGQ